jgi:outer membrane protein assembly factor BamB
MDFSRQAAHAAAGDWPTLLGSNARTGYNSVETAINSTTAAHLQLQWKFSSGNRISAQPVVVNGQVYWGSWDGNEYAADLTGKKLWTASIGGQAPNCNPPLVFGVGSTATVADISIGGTSTAIDFVGGLDAKSKVASLYALDASSGAILWETPLTSSTGSFVWSNPAVYNGSVYVGLSSVDDCPLIRGALIQLDAVSGAIQHTFYTVPGGCVGASIWGSPAIDEANGTIYVATGNYGKCSQTEGYAQSLIELNVSDLSLIASWEVPSSQRGVDSDFGVTPTLFTATLGGSTHNMVGLQNKNGLYYAFDRASLSTGPVWTATISSGNHSLSASAWDGTDLYVGGYVASIGGKNCKGSLRALNPSSGAFIWQLCLLDGPVFEPVSAVPGVIFVGEGPHFLAVDATTGKILFNYTTKGSIEAAASISNGMVYVGDNSGNLYAFGLPQSITPTPTSTATPGTTIAQDTFQRSDQPLWGTATDGQMWGADANTLSNFSITQQTGQIMGNGQAAAGYTAILGPAAADAQVQLSGSISSFGRNTLGAVLRWSDNNDFYKAYITGTNLVIQKKVQGAITNLKSTAFAAQPGTSYTILFSVVGATLSASVWPTGTTPPGTWMLSVTDSTLSSGTCGLLAYLASGVGANISAFQAVQN